MVFIVASLGSYFTNMGMGGWYETLNIPLWTPPGAFIGLVWTIIYILLTFSMILILSKRNIDQFKFIHIKRWFALNLILNLFWSFVFFANQEIFLAIFVAGMLALSVYILIYLVRPVSRWGAIALYPYAIWTTFATILNAIIWTLN